MKHRPLPITVTPVPDELLSGWLSRLAASNHCKVVDLLVHIGIDAKYAAALDHGIDMLDADRISVAARIDPAFVLSMTFAAMQEAECAHHGDPASDSMNIRPPVPRGSGHLFHGHPATLF